ncbi:Sialate O-acetylesterase [Seminavis robusta]|uniref:Sialate O-acetylesterase n=1 Tax=Seminavis robusta TaxID=568900 RepID=A0A9N8ELJ8_9STRA|nr:Sialate O-acetylesterase [Seminavis robusta]|eukprot:Sro1130_g244550.1 Sialate O-acetylesterase (570) ;mRNA; f:29745-31686
MMMMMKTTQVHFLLLLLLVVVGISLAKTSQDTVYDDYAREDSTPHPPLHTTALSQDDAETRNFVSATLGSNMVLQRDRPAVIWGFVDTSTTTATSTPIQVKTILQKGDYDPDPPLTTTVDPATGIWRQVLPPQNASMIPYTIHITSSAKHAVRLTNVLFGDVYLCGGQSNMQFTLDGTTNGTAEAKAGNDYPHIRLFTVGQGTNSPNMELDDLQTVLQPWTVANQFSLYSQGDKYFAFGFFSSTCWFFGQQVADGLDNQVPIGLISNNWGGTKIELWQPGGYLYNAMIHPYMVGPMAVTGFTWYQGEANTKNQTTANDYAQAFPRMITQWRTGFQAPHAYFGFVQLSTWCPTVEPEGVAMMRQAQMAVLEVLPSIGYSTNADHGAGCNIHPPPKQFCGKRVAYSALAIQYGYDDYHWKSPSYSKATLTKSPTTNNDIMVTIDLVDVTSKGLYMMMDEPYNSLNGTFDCAKQLPGTCAWASVKLSTQTEWVNATLSIQFPNQVVFTVTKQQQLVEHDDDATIEATSYGWGSVPMLTLYDAGTDLPVLPWKEPVGVQQQTGDSASTLRTAR